MRALAIFQQLNDPHGIAETLDLLGMASYLGGDLVQGTQYYEQAVTLFRQLDDRLGLTSSLASLTLRGALSITNTMVSAATTLVELLPDVEMALKIAREIGQRPGEAYALYQLGLCLSAQGEYRRALDALQQSLLIAEELEHHQWMITAHWATGALYLDLLSPLIAQHHLKQALRLSHEISSKHWTNTTTVKDILAHVTTWEEEALKYLPLITAGGSPPRYTQYGGIDAFNELMTNQKRGLALSDVLRQLDETHRRLIDYIQSVPEEHYTQETRFRHRLRLDTYSHYQMHAKAIREWRERLVE